MKTKPIQEQKKTQYPKILPQKPDPKNINPLKGYNIINAGYQDTNISQTTNAQQL